MSKSLTVSPSVCIVIPAYNEAFVITDVVTDLKQQLSKSNFNFIIVVVDDGSRDDTAKKAKAAGAYVIPHILNTGCGGATSTGLSYAQQNNFDIAATIDADGQHTSADLIKGLRVMMANQYDLLIGSRLIDSRGMSKVKILGNKGLSLVTRLLFSITVTDSQSGLRIFSRQALEQLKWKTSGYEFCSEMLWRAKQKNLRIGEYPIQAIYTDYSVSKGQNNWNAFRIINSLVKRRIVEMFGE